MDPLNPFALRSQLLCAAHEAPIGGKYMPGRYIVVTGVSSYGAMPPYMHIHTSQVGWIRSSLPGWRVSIMCPISQESNLCVSPIRFRPMHMGVRSTFQLNR
eukprot:15766-Eustigmatos_ZCMA.PRE.1